MLNKIKADGPCWAVYDKQPVALQHRWVGAAGKGAGSTTYILSTGQEQILHWWIGLLERPRTYLAWKTHRILLLLLCCFSEVKHIHCGSQAIFCLLMVQSHTTEAQTDSQDHVLTFILVLCLKYFFMAEFSVLSHS